MLVKLVNRASNWSAVYPQSRNIRYKALVSEDLESWINTLIYWQTNTPKWRPPCLVRWQNIATVRWPTPRRVILIHCVSKETTLMQHIITSTQIDQFWLFLAGNSHGVWAIIRLFNFLCAFAITFFICCEITKVEMTHLSFQSCCIPCLKNDTALACYIFNIHQPIIIFL